MSNKHTDLYLHVHVGHTPILINHSLVIQRQNTTPRGLVQSLSRVSLQSGAEYAVVGVDLRRNGMRQLSSQTREPE
jgi:hypothetical protein